MPLLELAYGSYKQRRNSFDSSPSFGEHLQALEVGGLIEIHKNVSKLDAVTGKPCQLRCSKACCAHTIVYISTQVTIFKEKLVLEFVKRLMISGAPRCAGSVAEVVKVEVRGC
jgi:hypothetical protein